MAELNKAGTRLDAARRQFYLKSQKHLKEHVAKKDNTAEPPPREDSDAALSGGGNSAISLGYLFHGCVRHCQCVWMVHRQQIP